jgi:hypothetical protein
MTVSALAVIMALVLLAFCTVLVLAAAGLKRPRYRRVNRPAVARRGGRTTATI